jgi:hypothetical protein
MEQNENTYGNRNANAPAELYRFAFLIGTWRGEARLKREDGTWDKLEAAWEGRYILDGYAIADEYRMAAVGGGLLVLGLNLRSYDAKRKAGIGEQRNRKLA